jgi:transcription elongation factor Elf1
MTASVRSMMGLLTDDPWTGGEQGISQWADDDPHDLLFQPRSPESLDAAMRCQGCGAEVEWRSARQSRKVFICPVCGERRWSKNAGKRLRHRTGERDGWICRRCGMSVDKSIA